MTHHTGLENRRSGNVTVGSNPTLSADFCDISAETKAAYNALFASRSTYRIGAHVGTERKTGKMVPGDNGEMVEQVIVDFPTMRPPRPTLLKPTPTFSTIYFIGSDGGPIKIGYTKDITIRLRDLRLANALPLSLLASTNGRTKLEREYHARFAAHRLHGEWFAPHPDILAEIDRLNTKDSSHG